MNSEESIFVIGIVGGSGSGKTLITHEIIKRLKSSSLSKIAVISEDRYYKDWGNLVGQEEAAKINYDHPDAFDHELLREHLSTLINHGESVKVPHYDYSTHSRVHEKSQNVKAGVNVIILEGIMLYVYGTVDLASQELTRCFRFPVVVLN